MHDINWIRENPQKFVDNMARRGEKVSIEEILNIDSLRRQLVTKLQTLQKNRNDSSDAIGMIKDKSSQEFSEAKLAVQKVNEEIQIVKAEEEKIDAKLLEILNELPNFLADDVPDGDGEEQNVVVSKFGEPTKFDFEPKAHFELGEKLGMMDFIQTVKISGSRFVTLKQDLARLERALASFMLDIHTREFGFKEISPPLLVKSEAMYGTGNLPKFHEDAFQTKDGYWLIPTSEVSQTNLIADKIIDQSELPMRYTAYTPCFRSEAGSAGRDTRGMIRLHQFNKVELVIFATEENYLAEYEHLTMAAEEILKRLKLPYQKVLKCSGDTTTFSAVKTYDLEVWLPAQNCYREISSCSLCTQFQARRMKARYRQKGEKETKFIYTMNGSGLAVGRTIVAIMENYQNEDGSVNIPEALKPYMGGQTVIK